MSLLSWFDIGTAIKDELSAAAPGTPVYLGYSPADVDPPVIEILRTGDILSPKNIQTEGESQFLVFFWIRNNGNSVEESYRLLDELEKKCFPALLNFSPTAINGVPVSVIMSLKNALMTGDEFCPICGSSLRLSIKWRIKRG